MNKTARLIFRVCSSVETGWFEIKEQIFGRGSAADGLEVYPLLLTISSSAGGIKSNSQSALSLIVISIFSTYY